MRCKCGRLALISVGGYCPDCLPRSRGGTVDEAYSEHVREHQAHAIKWIDDPEFCPVCGKRLGFDKGRE